MNGKPEKLSAKQVERLWEYRNSVDREFYTRLNFFLVFESILIAAVSLLVNKTSDPLIHLLGLLGLTITLIFAYAQLRVKYVLDKLKQLCDVNIPEYALFRAIAWWPRLSSTTLLTWAPPSLITAIWIVILFK